MASLNKRTKGKIEVMGFVKIFVLFNYALNKGKALIAIVNKR